MTLRPDLIDQHGDTEADVMVRERREGFTESDVVVRERLTSVETRVDEGFSWLKKAVLGLYAFMAAMGVGLAVALAKPQTQTEAAQVFEAVARLFS